MNTVNGIASWKGVYPSKSTPCEIITFGIETFELWKVRCLHGVYWKDCFGLLL